MRALRRAAALAALALVGGCSVVEPAGAERDALEDARERWEGRGLASYRTTETRLCFCHPDWIGPVQLRVTPAGVTRTFVADGRAVPADSERFFPTVEALFDLIEEALDEGAHSVEATYDPATGAPLEVFIDYEEQVADEEQGWRLTVPEPL